MISGPRANNRLKLNAIGFPATAYPPLPEAPAQK
jgi:hypothetical protein